MRMSSSGCRVSSLTRQSLVIVTTRSASIKGSVTGVFLLSVGVHVSGPAEGRDVGVEREADDRQLEVVESPVLTEGVLVFGNSDAQAPEGDREHDEEGAVVERLVMLVLLDPGGVHGPIRSALNTGTPNGSPSTPSGDGAMGASSSSVASRIRTSATLSLSM